MPIPISDIVNLNPGVVSAGGTPLALNGVLLTKNTKLPAKTVVPFTSAAAVTQLFGAGTTEATMAANYFLGYDNSPIKPSVLYMAAFADVARAGWMRSGSWLGQQIADVQALGSGTVIVVVNGVTFTSGTINLALSSGFSSAAALITAGFSGGGAPVCTWEPSSATFLISSPTTGAATSVTFATGTLATGLKMTSATNAYLSAGSDADTPAGVMDIVRTSTQNWAAFTTTWEPGIASKKAFADWTTGQNSRFGYALYDSDPKAIASLDLTANLSSGAPVYTTSAFGQALQSPPSAADTAAPAVTGPNFTVSLRMASGGGSGKKVMINQNGCFQIYKASGGTLLTATYGSVTLSSSQALSATEAHIELSVSDIGANLFYNGTVVATSATGATAAGCVYVNKLNIGYGSAVGVDGWSGNLFDVGVYNTTVHTAAFTPSPSPLTGNETGLVALWSLNGTLANSTTSFGEYAKTVKYDSVLAIYNTKEAAAFALGMAASTDFTRTNGRITPAFKRQAGLLPTVTDKTTADRLRSLGYSYYGNYAGNNVVENFFFDGKMYGKWNYWDTFIDQVFLNSQIQSALLYLLLGTNSIPYNQEFYTKIANSLQDPISQAVNAGIIRRGVTLSSTQLATINQAAGLDMSSALFNNGYYLQILDPGAQARQARGSPIINLWWTDGGSIHKLEPSSITII